MCPNRNAGMFQDKHAEVFLNSSVVPFHGITARLFLDRSAGMSVPVFPDRGVTMFQSNNADMFQNSPA